MLAATSMQGSLHPHHLSLQWQLRRPHEFPCGLWASHVLSREDTRLSRSSSCSTCGRLPLPPASLVVKAGGTRGVFPRKDDRNIHSRSIRLLQMLRNVGNVKEDVYSTLDEWCAWELTFPVMAVKSALTIFRKDGNWLRILQVCKWMLAKGQGKTLGTYRSMLEAYAALGRFEEMDALWARVLKQQLDCLPRHFFHTMLQLCQQRGRQTKVVEVFGSMEALGVRPDEPIMEIVQLSLREMGAPALADRVRREYPPTRVELRRIKGRRVPVRVQLPPPPPTEAAPQCCEDTASGLQASSAHEEAASPERPSGAAGLLGPEHAVEGGQSVSLAWPAAARGGQGLE